MKNRKTPLAIGAAGLIALAASSQDFSCNDERLDEDSESQVLDGGDPMLTPEDQEPLVKPIQETREEIAEVVNLDDVLDGASDHISSLYKDCDFSFYGDDTLRAEWKSWEAQQSEAVDAVLSQIIQDCAAQKELERDLEIQMAQAKVEAMLDFRDDLEQVLKERGCVIERSLEMSPRFEIVLSEGELSDDQWNVVETTEHQEGAVVADPLLDVLASLSKKVLSVRVNVPEYDENDNLVIFGGTVTGEIAGESVEIQVSSEDPEKALDELVNGIMEVLKGC